MLLLGGNNEFQSVENYQNKLYSLKELGERLGGSCGEYKDGYVEFFHTKSDQYFAAKIVEGQQRKIIRPMTKDEIDFYVNNETSISDGR